MSIDTVSITQPGRKYLQMYNIIPSSHAKEVSQSKNNLPICKLPQIVRTQSQTNIKTKAYQHSRINSNRHALEQQKKCNKSLLDQCNAQERTQQLRMLPFQLNKIHQLENMKRLDRKVKNESLCSLRRQLLRDIVCVNKFTSQKATQLADKLYSMNERLIQKQNSCRSGRLSQPNKQLLNSKLKQKQIQKQSQTNRHEKNKSEQKINIFMELSKGRNYLARINYLHNEKQAKFENIKKFLKNKNKENNE